MKKSVKITKDGKNKSDIDLFRKYEQKEKYIEIDLPK